MRLFSRLWKPTQVPQPALARLRLEALEDRCVPSVVPVTSTLDDVSQRGTLRYAVAHASAGDTILLTGAVAKAGITLTQGELILNQQDLTIRSTAAPNPVTISGGDLSRVFEVKPGASVMLRNLIIAAGDAQTGNISDFYEGRGGGIVVDVGATLTLTDCTVSDSFAPFVAGKGGLGGGIADYGTLTMIGCTLSNNHALGTLGGGIAVFSGGLFSPLFTATLTISDSTLSDNTAAQNGGAICDVSSTVAVNNCDVTGNSVSTNDGGGLNNHLGIMTVGNSASPTTRR